MRTIALIARILATGIARTASAFVLLAFAAAAPASAQQATPLPPAPAAPAPIIRHIQVTGTQRIEATTVLSYITLREGDPFDPAQEDAALHALTATGLFSDVIFDPFDPVTGTLTVHVVENPIVNQVVFEGNNALSSKDLTTEVQIKPRAIFTRSKVQADVQRIVELYRRNGKFGATVDPQIIQRPQNRVDLIFSINEGPTTGVSRINFIGNKVFDSDTLRGQIATEESAWYKFLSTSDNYDPDRLTFDGEKLRQFYEDHGYADFSVVSAVAELAPDRRSFYITFTVSEGPRYKFGKVEINSTIKELSPSALRPVLEVTTGDVYDADEVQSSIDALTNAAGTKGYAFAQVHPRLARNRVTNTIDMIFDIDQGPRVYIEKIDIVGNTRTLDKVIRREFRLVEGDAFNQVLVDRSRTRIRALGFFSNVTVKQSPGTQPDRTDLTVTVAEQSTGSLSLGAGYSSASRFVGEFSYTEINLFGRGQLLRLGVQASQISKQINLSFTEPAFLDRTLATGFDLYKTFTDFTQATYSSDVDAGILRMGFPISEYSSVNILYTAKIEKIVPFTNAPLAIANAAGTTEGSSIGFGYNYNTLDDPIKPTTGFNFDFHQEISGFGGNLRYIKETSDFATYHPMFGESVVASLSGQAGLIEGYDGSLVPLEERFFEGGSTFRGFAIAGVGPRDTSAASNTGELGEDLYAIGTIQARFPTLLPESYGINLALFSDFGTAGKLDTPNSGCTVTSCVRDSLAFRASAGISIKWKSPFGPIQIDLGYPLVKQSYDRAQIINFTSGTGF